MRSRDKRFVVGAVVALLTTLGASAINSGVAHASAVTLTVTPSSGLADGDAVSVTVHGATPSTEGRVYISECGNAYANGTLLPTTVDAAQDCTTIGWIDSPFPASNLTIKETGIGLGNRSCVANGNRACYVYAPEGLNVNPLPTPPVAITFANNATGTGAQPSPTTTT